MTPRTSADRRERVRRAYERGRWLRALPWAVPALVLAAVGWGFGAVWAPVIGPVLGSALVCCGWRGGDAGRAAEAGFLAGLLPCVGVGGLQLVGKCGAVPCAVVCGAAGIAVAAVLARGLRREPPGWAAAAVGVAALTGAIPCLALGVAGLAVLPALLGAAVPVAVLRRVP